MKSHRFLFPVLLLITLITYYPTIGAGFVYDFLGWQRLYDKGSFGDIFTSFGYHGNHQVLHFFFYSIYALFHIKGLPWYIIFCSIHAFNGWLLYTWLMQLSDRWSLHFSKLIALLFSILFIIHPYNVEPVVWKVCIHYLLSFSAVFGILLLSPAYIHEGNKRSMQLSLVVFLLSLFLLEISFVTPAVISLFLLVQSFVLAYSKSMLRRSVISAGSMWALLAGYILLTKLTLGTWVGHYGTKVHLRLDLIGMMSTEVKYLVKHLTDARYFSFKAKVMLFDTMLSIPELIFFILCAGLVLTIVYFLKAKKISGRWHLVFFSVIASMLYILPVSNIFFYHIGIGMNDRYGYLPIPFLIAGLIAILTSAPKWLNIALAAVIVLINLYLQEKTIRYWHESTEVLTHLKETYHWQDSSYVFILNSPDNMNGITMASIIEAPSGIDELIDFQTSKPNTGITFDIFQYNMTTPYDGVKVEQTGPMQLKVTFHQWGNWWHRNGIGASSYENEFYKADILDYPYQVTFKQFPKGSVILYQDGSTWKEFKLQR